MEMKVGQIIKKSKIFDRQSVINYAKLTGDFNPVHFDEIYASKTVFKKPIVHGPLVLTMVTTIFANEFPGPGSVYLSHNVKYISPVYYEDTITAILEIVEINLKNHIFIKTTCINQKGVIILDGIARLKKY
jgi:3-hydroxybutyryl-CoA dehydratase